MHLHKGSMVTELCARKGSSLTITVQLCLFMSVSLHVEMKAHTRFKGPYHGKPSSLLKKNKSLFDVVCKHC